MSYARQERSVIDHVNREAWLRHVPDRETQRIDATVVQEVTRDRLETIPLLGRSSIPRATDIEIKVCQRWISSGDHRRRGRWQINVDKHRDLSRAGGVYLLGVLDDGRVLSSALVDAGALDRAVESRATNYGDSLECRETVAALPWSVVFRDDFTTHSTEGGGLDG